MGKRDSSLTRAKPVFDYLLEADQTGVAWLPTLLGLPDRTVILDSEGPGLSQRGRGPLRNEALTHRVAY